MRLGFRAARVWATLPHPGRRVARILDPGDWAKPSIARRSTATCWDRLPGVPERKSSAPWASIWSSSSASPRPARATMQGEPPCGASRMPRHSSAAPEPGGIQASSTIARLPAASAPQHGLSVAALDDLVPHRTDERGALAPQARVALDHEDPQPRSICCRRAGLGTRVPGRPTAVCTPLSRSPSRGWRPYRLACRAPSAPPRGSAGPPSGAWRAGTASG